MGAIKRLFYGVLSIVLVEQLCLGSAKIIRYTAEKDSRDIFSIEEFGLVKNGFINVTVSNLHGADTVDHFTGFVISRTQTIGKALEVIRKERIAYSNGNRRCSMFCVRDG